MSCYCGDCPSCGGPSQVKRSISGPHTCTHDAGHPGPCNGRPRLLQPERLGIFCRPVLGTPGYDHFHQVNRYGVCRICAQRSAKRSITGPPHREPAWVSRLKEQLKAVTAERDQWREAAESCSGAVERLAVQLRAERASHHD